MKFIYIILFSMLTISVSGQSKIEKAKENLSQDLQIQGGNASNSNRNSSRSSSSSHYSGEGIFAGILLDLTIFLAYYVAFETPLEQESQMYNSTLSPYPFYAGAKGDYNYVRSDDYIFWRLEGSNYYFSEKGKFFMNDLNLKIRLGNRFALKAEYLHFWEKLLANKNSKLDMLTLTGQYFRIRTPRVSLHWGLGASYIGNEINQLGFATELGNEIFIKPFSLYTDLKYSAFRNSDVYHFSIGPKFYFRNYNIGIKYQYVNLAGSKASGVSFGVGAIF
ncbi:hypothetical protein [Capnocytophaga stomatis]|uniref:Outer membrane protein beta-barrel domain-containing protein n=1 Tax=Capnocytophaga stomatis TaxID=1848904 RepID=A0ABW8Q8E7_9FLAO|nr:hypothetical protein [Capnocytophaga stomatis]